MFSHMHMEAKFHQDKKKIDEALGMIKKNTIQVQKYETII